MGLLGSLGRRILRGVDSTAEITVGVLAAALFSQLGAFMQQYIQNLAGRLDEASRDVAGIATRAAEAGLDTARYIGEFLAATNPIFVREGAALQSKLDRWAELAAARDALQDAGLFGRPVAFVQHLDLAIAGNVWRNFRPALPLDLASIVYGVAGIILALMIYHGVRSLLVSAFRGRRPVTG